jgi:beta-N-acetylhexosaminidase
MYPVIIGISGQALTNEEREFFRAFPPFGFILFKRNIDNPEQVKKLIQDLREVTGREDTPVLLDQEGARVQKLRPPHWVDLPSMRMIGDLFLKNSLLGMQAVKLHAGIIAGQMNELGADVVCGPVVDVVTPGAHDVIGDRAFGETADIVVPLASTLAKELLANGITPIIKHIPGHGRADLDSHFDLPVVSTDLETLNETDFKAFKQVAQNSGAEKIWAMTAHVLFKALDDKMVTISRKSIDFIRNELGIKGPILADNIEMDSLGGDLPSRALAALDAGCDAFLYCDGSLQHAKEILSAVPQMTDTAKERFDKASKEKSETHQIDWRSKFDELKKLFGVTQFRGYRAKEDITEELVA